MALKKRADGRYTKQIYLGKGEDGKRKYKTFFGATQKEVIAKTDEARLLLGKGINIASAADTFAVWASKYKSVKVAQGVGASHLRSIKNHVDHLAPVGTCEIKKINTGDIQAILNALAEWHDGKPPLSRKTLGQITGTARRIFDLAIQNRVIDFNPAQYVTVPNGAGKLQREALTAEQQQMVTDTEHRAQLAAMLMMYVGVRAVGLHRRRCWERHCATVGAAVPHGCWRCMRGVLLCARRNHRNRQLRNRKKKRLKRRHLILKS